jgi:1-acyl-sn-glycerol-3-phosphate acyltransferase
MDRLLRALGLLAVRLFYRTIAVEHAERIPLQGPVIVVANHPNGLLDPVVSRIALRRPLAFLAKSTLFGNPFGRWLMRSFDAIPVYRSRDGEDTSRNERTFELCHALLARAGWLMLFPEGTSHSDPAMHPLKTGAARIALGAERTGAHGVTILPVGLLYEDKEIFRTQVAASIGLPIPVAQFLPGSPEDERASVLALTAEIQKALDEVVLQAESDELWHGFLAVAAWTSKDAHRDVGARESRAHELAQAWSRLAERDPPASEKVAAAARRFSRTLKSVGVADPFSIDDPSAPSGREILFSLSSIILLTPMALIGLVLGIVPYRAVALLLAIAKKRHLDTDLTSTLKALAGLVFFLLTYVAEALVAGIVGGASVGGAVFVLAPAAGFLTLRWLERIELRREAFHGWWLRSRRASLVEAIARRRRELCDLVEAGLARTAAETDTRDRHQAT